MTYRLGAKPASREDPAAQIVDLCDILSGCRVQTGRNKAFAIQIKPSKVSASDVEESRASYCCLVVGIAARASTRNTDVCTGPYSTSSSRIAMIHIPVERN